MAAAYGISSELKNRIPYYKLFPKLSRREIEVLVLYCSGMLRHEIALELHISISTVETHLSNAMHKYELERYSELRHLFYLKFINALANIIWMAEPINDLEGAR
ncbi:response regulator transcription factor [Arsenophonus nasoniae]|uniref:response regulator transcription factor n=1 Tax=Arsenophonus nasoniae TaxID=638 RepID=UPI003879EEE4